MFADLKTGRQIISISSDKNKTKQNKVGGKLFFCHCCFIRRAEVYQKSWLFNSVSIKIVTIYQLASAEIGIFSWFIYIYIYSYYMLHFQFKVIFMLCVYKVYWYIKSNKRLKALNFLESFEKSWDHDNKTHQPVSSWWPGPKEDRLCCCLVVMSHRSHLFPTLHPFGPHRVDFDVPKVRLKMSYLTVFSVKECLNGGNNLVTGRK